MAIMIHSCINKVSITPSIKHRQSIINNNKKVYCFDSIFVVSEASVVKPVFSVSGDDDYIKLTVPTGIDQQKGNTVDLTYHVL